VAFLLAIEACDMAKVSFGRLVSLRRIILSDIGEDHTIVRTTAHSNHVSWILFPIF
jgi:hypothetical protein